MEVEKIVKPKELFETLKFKDVDEAESAFKYALEFLLYMNVGDVIDFPSASFEKISDELIYLKPKITNDLVDVLENKRIIKFSF
jgi:hypothetical protein